MADLQSRVGHFANKSWVRPGFEVPKKSQTDVNGSPPSNSQRFSILGAAGGSSGTPDHDLSNQGAKRSPKARARSYFESGSQRDKPATHSRTASHSPRKFSGPRISLLERMGMQPEDHEKEEQDVLEAERVEKSLIERMGGTESVVNPGSTSLWAPTMDDGAMERNSGSDSSSFGERSRPRNSGNPLAMDKNVEPGTEYGANHDRWQSPRRRDNSHSVEQDDNGHRGGPRGYANGGGIGSAAIEEHPSSNSHSHATSPEPSAVSSVSGDQAISSSLGDCLGGDERQISESMTPEEFLNIIIPLTSRIAQARATDSGASQPPQVDPTVVTREDLVSFAKQMQTVGKDLDLRNSTSSTMHVNSNEQQLHDTAADKSAQPPRNNQPSERVHENGHKPSLLRPTISIDLRYTPSPERHGETSLRTPLSPTTSYSKTPTSRHHPEHRYPRRKSPSPRRRYRDDDRDRERYRGKTKDSDSNYHDRDHRRRPGKGPSHRRSASPIWRRGGESNKFYKSKDRRGSPTRSPRQFRQGVSPPQRRRERSPISPKKGYPPWSARPNPSHSRSRSPGAGRRPGSNERLRRDQRHYDDVHERRSDKELPITPRAASGRPMSDSGYGSPRSSREKNQSVEAVSQSGVPSSPTAKQTFLPCHNVPGLWFAQQGLHNLGTALIEFEIDDQTALKWNIQGDLGNAAGRTSNDTKTAEIQPEKLSLELCCLSLRDMQATMLQLGEDVTSSALVEGLAALEKAWPAQGNLIISINPDISMEKSWLPDKLAAPALSVQLEDHVQKGTNHVRLIQLSDLSETMFVLLATIKQAAEVVLPEKETCCRPEFVPLQQDGFGLTPAVLDISEDK